VGIVQTGSMVRGRSQKGLDGPGRSHFQRRDFETFQRCNWMFSLRR
jgi:hypothetical protein